MKSYRKELWFNVTKRREFINITPQVNSCLKESGVQEGIVLVNAMHITASVFINDDESGLHHDYEECWKSWHLMNRFLNTVTTIQVRIMAMRTLSGR